MFSFNRFISSVFLLSFFVSFNSFAISQFDKSHNFSACIPILKQLVEKLDLVDTKKVPIGKNSLARKVKGYKRKLEWIERYIPDVKRFITQYEKTYKKNPTNIEILAYQYESNQKLVEIAKEFYVEGDKEINRYVSDLVKSLEYSDRVKHKLREHINHSGDFYNALYNPKNHEFLKIKNRYERSYVGPIGEFDVLMRLDNLYAQSVMIGTEQSKRTSLRDPSTHAIEKILQNKVVAAFDRANIKTAKEFRMYNSLYPQIFKDSYINKNLYLDISEVISRVRNRVFSKEIDIVLKEDNTYVFLEVKNLGHVAKKNNIVSLKKKGRKNKWSILRQQLFMKEIIEFIGMKDEIEFGIVFRHGVTYEGAQLLQDHGIRVIGPRSGKQ